MLTKEQRKKIVDRVEDYIKPYVVLVMKELPHLENDFFIEDIASCWSDSEFILNRKISFKKALERYKKQYTISNY